MDTSKYNFKKLEESNEDGVFSQKFYDEDKHVSYSRMTWLIDLNEDEKSALLSVLDLPKVVSNVLPNVIKYEINDNSYEILSFSDDDMEFNSRKLMSKILEPYSNELISAAMKGDRIWYNKVLSQLSEDEEYIKALKEIYKDYLDKEL